jgi:hypothetical protein
MSLLLALFARRHFAARQKNFESRHFDVKASGPNAPFMSCRPRQFLNAVTRPGGNGASLRALHGKNPEYCQARAIDQISAREIIDTIGLECELLDGRDLRLCRVNEPERQA